MIRVIYASTNKKNEKKLKAGILGTLGVLMLTSAVELRAETSYEKAVAAGKEMNEHWWNEYTTAAGYYNDPAVYIVPPAGNTYPAGFRFGVVLTQAYADANKQKITTVLAEINADKQAAVDRIKSYAGLIARQIKQHYNEQAWNNGVHDEFRRKLQGAGNRTMWVAIGSAGGWLLLSGYATITGITENFSQALKQTAQIVVLGAMLDLCNKIAEKGGITAGVEASRLGILTLALIEIASSSLTLTSGNNAGPGTVDDFFTLMEDGYGLDTNDFYYDGNVYNPHGAR